MVSFTRKTGGNTGRPVHHESIAKYEYLYKIYCTQSLCYRDMDREPTAWGTGVPHLVFKLMEKAHQLGHKKFNYVGVTRMCASLGIKPPPWVQKQIDATQTRQLEASQEALERTELESVVSQTEEALRSVARLLQCSKHIKGKRIYTVCSLIDSLKRLHDDLDMELLKLPPTE